MQNAVQRVQAAIERGTFLQQCTSVLILRLTPVVPFRFALNRLSVDAQTGLLTEVCACAVPAIICWASRR